MEVHGWSSDLKSKGKNTSVENYDIKDNGFCITYKPWYFCKKLKILWLFNLCQIVDTIFSRKPKEVSFHKWCFLWVQKYWNWSSPRTHSWASTTFDKLILGSLLRRSAWLGNYFHNVQRDSRHSRLQTVWLYPYILILFQ